MELTEVLGTAALSGRVGTAAELAGRVTREVTDLLPVPVPLRELFPTGGLRRGSAIAVAGSYGLLLALLGAVSTTGAWCAVVGLPALGIVAAAEAGVSLDRLALVPDPGADPVGVLAALIDGVDLLVIGAPAALRAVEIRRLMARARQRGSVLVGFGAWPGAELRLSVSGARWQGLGDGHGYLRARQLSVQLEGRGGAGRPRRVTVWLPAAGGGIAAVVPQRRMASVAGSTGRAVAEAV
jgi:hypothetical protein